MADPLVDAQAARSGGGSDTLDGPSDTIDGPSDDDSGDPRDGGESRGPGGTPSMHRRLLEEAAGGWGLSPSPWAGGAILRRGRRGAAATPGDDPMGSQREEAPAGSQGFLLSQQDDIRSLPAGMLLSPAAGGGTQTQAVQAAIDASVDASVAPAEAMAALYRFTRQRLGLNASGGSVTIKDPGPQGDPDECMRAMDDIGEKRFLALQRVRKKHEGDWRADLEGSEMQKELREVNDEADRCQKLVWNWEVARRAARAIFSLEAGCDWDASCKDLPVSMKIKTIQELYDDRGMNVYNQCVLHLQDCFRAGGFRRHDGAVFTRVSNSLGQVTIAWKRIDSIRQFIYKHINQNVRPDLWTAITNTTTVDRLETYYVESGNPGFPVLVKNRHLFSFDDGVFDAGSGEFHRYPLGAGHPLLEYTASRHFEKPFPAAFYRGPSDISHWRDIPTPGVRGIFQYQGLSERDEEAEGLRRDSVEDWYYRLTGRMFFDIGELDDFQVMKFFLGRAGTGKSTMAHHASGGVYEEEDVKQGDNVIERQFGLWPLMDALVVKFTEVKSNFQLDQAQLQEMVSGGSINVARKNMMASQMSKWRAHLVMCGNEMPGYHDKQGSLRRRYVIFNLTRKVVNEDADIKTVIRADMPYFILKCAMAYRELVVFEGVRAGIWNHLPKHFHDNANMIDDNSLNAFMRSDRLRLQTETGCLERCDFREFKQEYKRFCADECLTRNVDLNSPPQYQSIFDDNRVEVVKQSRFNVLLKGVSIVDEEERDLCEEEEERASPRKRTRDGRPGSRRGGVWGSPGSPGGSDGCD